MDKYEREIAAFKKEATSEYFKMQMEDDKKRKTLYSSAVILMIFLPLLIVSYRNYKRFNQMENNRDRIQENREEIQSLATNFISNEYFISNLKFVAGKSKIYLSDIYNGKYNNISIPVYFDKDYTHQCLGYILVTKEKDSYSIDTSQYCQM